MEIWKFNNPHPQKKLLGDCVVRAYCLATGMDYLEARRELNRANKELKCRHYTAREFTPKFFNMKGFEKLSFPARAGYARMNGQRFAETYTKGRYILNMAHHLSCCIDGVINDTWDCSEKCVYNAWKIPEADDSTYVKIGNVKIKLTKEQKLELYNKLKEEFNETKNK